MDAQYSKCTLCPRMCRVNRYERVGVCGAGATVRAGRAALHWWEEPCLVGDQGSGTVFFSHCPLRCVYCQNRVLVEGVGVDVSPGELAAAVLRLQNEEGAANINLVTGTHFVPSIVQALEPLRASGQLRVPVVWNTSGFERVETLAALDGLVDVYLTDFKYASAGIAREFSHAPEYPEVALRALGEMLRQQPVWEENGQSMLQRGVIVRHLVLPGRVKDSLAALDLLHSQFGSGLRLSLMSQFTPLPEAGLARFGLDAPVSVEEYERVLDHADSLGFENYFWQQGGAAEESFIPAFDGTGL